MSVGAGAGVDTSGSDNTSSRRKSLVRRSRSRGRKVTFSVEEEGEETTIADVYDAGEAGGGLSGKARAKAKARRDSGASVGPKSDRDESGSQTKGKAGRREDSKRQERREADDAPASGSGSDDDDDERQPVRGRSFVRGQTPGPPSRVQVSAARGKSRAKP